MASPKLKFNYHDLDRFLVQDYDPRMIGEQLDTLMNDLVHLAGAEPDYGLSLREHYYILRHLRDIFRQIPKSAIKP
jgi:hypothetical protein